jgi:hypothetical protein
VRAEVRLQVADVHRPHESTIADMTMLVISYCLILYVLLRFFSGSERLA